MALFSGDQGMWAIRALVPQGLSSSIFTGDQVLTLQRARGALADPVGQLEHVLRALRGLVLDEVRLVDDHPAEAEVAEPAHVTVEHLVVEHDGIGEAVDSLAGMLKRLIAKAQREKIKLARFTGFDVSPEEMQAIVARYAAWSAGLRERGRIAATSPA